MLDLIWIPLSKEDPIIEIYYLYTKKTKLKNKRNYMSDIFDIFSGIMNEFMTANKSEKDAKQNLLDNTKVNGIDMKDVSKEDLDETMEYLDNLGDNTFVATLLGDEFINNFKAELQAKWDIAHPEEEPEEEEETTSPVDTRINELVDEYVKTLHLPEDSLMNPVVSLAKQQYFDFAKFIYNHE